MENYQLPRAVLSPCVQAFIELLLNEAGEVDKGIYAGAKTLHARVKQSELLTPFSTTVYPDCPSHSAPTLDW